MRTTLLLACLVLAATPAAATTRLSAPGDTITQYQLANGWFSRDKSYHLAVSAAGAAGIYAAGRELGLGRWPSAVGAAVVMGTVGFLREAYKRDDPNFLTRERFSRKDMAWNGAGIVLGISLTDLIGHDRWRGNARSSAVDVVKLPP